jgi:siroheme decarboxylase
LDETDGRLLNIIQTEFPLCSRPYVALGEQLGISEGEALSRVRALVDGGVVRKVGPTFDSRKLGHSSVLVAARVPADRLEKVAEIVSSYKEVTHNYARDFEYNLWFTLVCSSPASLEATLDRIKAETGIADMHQLPAERMFKIRVEFGF